MADKVCAGTMIGKTLAPYEIIDKLGQGGMGPVWRARDTKLGREVAIQTLPEEFTRDADRLARFEREDKDHSCVRSVSGKTITEKEGGTNG